MAKQKKQLWRNPDPRMRQIREEHAALGKKLWRRSRYKGGEEINPAVTLAEEANRVRKLQNNGYDRWLKKETEAVVKFFKPGWWLNPIKWFKAHAMRRRKDLCTYMVTSPHMAKSSDKRSKPVMSGLLDYGSFGRPFKSLLRLSKRVFRWFKKLSSREQFRRDVKKNMKELAEKYAKESALKKVKALIALDNKAKSPSLWAQSMENHQKYKAKLAREKGEMRDVLKRWYSEGIPLGKKGHNDFMARIDRELVCRKREIDQFKGQIAKQKELREQKHAERGELEVKETSEREERWARIKKGHENRMAELARRGEERKESYRQFEARMAESDRQIEQIEQALDKIDVIVKRRKQELKPTVKKLQAMMAMLYIAQQSGWGTASGIARVIAQHNRIAKRNGLKRQGFNYTYIFKKDRRRYSGPEVDAPARSDDDLLISKANSCGPIRI